MIFTLYRDFLSLTRIARKLIKNTCEMSTELKKANKILNDVKIK